MDSLSVSSGRYEVGEVDVGLDDPEEGSESSAGAGDLSPAEIGDLLLESLDADLEAAESWIVVRDVQLGRAHVLIGTNQARSTSATRALSKPR